MANQLEYDLADLNQLRLKNYLERRPNEAEGEVPDIEKLYRFVPICTNFGHFTPYLRAEG